MSMVNVFHYVNSSFLLLLIVVSAPTSLAEVGVGVIENPVTREYTEEVYKDWQEGVVLNPQTGDYIITYKTFEGSFSEVVFEPATKINPILKSKFTQAGKGNWISYEYNIENGADAKQPIQMLITTVTNLNPGSPMGPSDWWATVVPTLKSFDLRLSWSKKLLGEKVYGIAPGKSLGGFKLESNDLPGVTIVEIRGYSVETTWLGHVPEIDTPVGKKVSDLQYNNFITRFAAAPKIRVPDPFDTAVVLVGVQKHIKQDLLSMQLIDPVFATQLDSILQAAIDAAKLSATKAVRDHLKDLRKLLKKEHADVDKEDDEVESDPEKVKSGQVPIDKLAAKVLDFDFKYVEKRLK